MIKRNSFCLYYFQRFSPLLDCNTASYSTMSTHLAITGVTGGGAPNRLEINDFVKNVRFFSLYVQALRKSTTNCHRYLLIRFPLPEAMSANDQGLVQSFFSVGGIHGLPFQTRDGATGSKPFDPNGNQWGGYCTHGSVLFPTWHRPYVMLYEVCPTSFFLNDIAIDEAIILLANFATAGRGNRCDIHSRHTSLEESSH